MHSSVKRRKLEGIQPSISRFFAPKRGQETHSAPLSLDTESTNNCGLKNIDENDEDERNSESEATSNVTIQHVNVRPRAKGPEMTGRTERFKYTPLNSGSHSSSPAIASYVSTPEKRQRHEKWVRRVGSAKTADFKNDDLPAQAAMDCVDDQETAEDAGNPPQTPLRAAFATDLDPIRASRPSSEGKRLTPLEQQFVDLKRKYGEETILVIEVGYKFRFFGQDAVVASKELHIYCSPGRTKTEFVQAESMYDRFASAMIPVPRLMVHVKR